MDDDDATTFNEPAVRALLAMADTLGLEILMDNDGQLVIYTGMTIPVDDNPVHTVHDAVRWDGA